MKRERGLTAPRVERARAKLFLVLCGAWLLGACSSGCEPPSPSRQGTARQRVERVDERPWRVTPSLYPVDARRPTPGDAILVVAGRAEASLDGEPLQDATPDALSKALKQRAGARETLWILGDVPEPEVLMGWLRAAQAAGFQGFGVSVWGVPGGGSTTERAYGRVHRFARSVEPAGLTVQISPRRALVRLEQCEPTSQWCQPAGSEGRPRRLLEARSGVSLFGALRLAAPHWARPEEACVLVDVLAPVSVEHLLNASAIAASVPQPGAAVADGETPTTRAALFEWLRRAQGRRHCVRLRLPR